MSEKKKGRAPKPDKFHDHIKSHLSSGDEVICKICGKTYKEIMDDKNEDR